MSFATRRRQVLGLVVCGVIVGGLAAAKSVRAAGALPFEMTVPIETDQFRFVKVVGQPQGFRTKPHGHTLDRINIYLTPGSMRLVDTVTGQTQVLDYVPGTVMWAPAGPNQHYSENLGTVPLVIYEIEIKRRANVAPATAFSSRDPIRVHPGFYRVEIDNPLVRVLRVSIPANGKVAMHEHTTNRLVVFLTQHHFRVTTADGKSWIEQDAAGDAVTGGPLSASEENLASTPFEAIMIDLKN